MKSSANVRSQLIRVIFIIISVIIQCDGQSDCGPGKVLIVMKIFTQTNTLILVSV